MAQEGKAQMPKSAVQVCCKGNWEQGSVSVDQGLAKCGQGVQGANHQAGVRGCPLTSWEIGRKLIAGNASHWPVLTDLEEEGGERSCCPWSHGPKGSAELGPWHAQLQWPAATSGKALDLLQWML